MTDAIKIRAQGLLREVLFPQAGREEVDLKGGMGIDTLEHIHQIDIGIDALEPTRGEQTLDDAHMASAHFRPAEQPVFSAHGNGPNFPLQMIGINGHVGIGRETLSRRLRARAHTQPLGRNGLVGSRTSVITVCLSQAKKASTSGLVSSPRYASFASAAKPCLRISASSR